MEPSGKKIDLKNIDFANVKEQFIDDDASKTNSVKDVTDMIIK